MSILPTVTHVQAFYSFGTGYLSRLSTVLTEEKLKTPPVVVYISSLPLWAVA